MSDRVVAFIPAYNEGARLGPVVTQARGVVELVVVIDDGSSDGTAAVAREAGAVVLEHRENRGKGAAILTGLQYLSESGAEYGIFLDADGQHDPAEIPQFVATATRTGAGIVVGTRMADVKDMPRIRLWTNQFTSWVTGKLARQRVPDSQCGYRLVRRSVVPVLRFSTAHFETETEMLIQAGRAGYRIESLPIRTIYVAGRISRILPWRDSVRFCKLAWRYW